jgi:hypothetical protein
MARYDPTAIFGNYAMRRSMLMDMVMSNDLVVRGLWRDTLFPALKDLIRYGADTLHNSGRVDDFIDAATDAAAATLGAMAPEFLPAIAELKKLANPAAKDATGKALQAIHDWTIRSSLKQPVRTSYATVEDANPLD